MLAFVGRQHLAFSSLQVSPVLQCFFHFWFCWWFLHFTSVLPLCFLNSLGGYFIVSKVKNWTGPSGHCISQNISEHVRTLDQADNNYKSRFVHPASAWVLTSGCEKVLALRGDIGGAVQLRRPERCSRTHLVLSWWSSIQYLMQKMSPLLLLQVIRIDWLRQDMSRFKNGRLSCSGSLVSVSTTVRSKLQFLSKFRLQLSLQHMHPKASVKSLKCCPKIARLR